MLHGTADAIESYRPFVAFLLDEMARPPAPTPPLRAGIVARPATVSNASARLGLARSDDAAADTVLNRMLDRLAASLGKRDYEGRLRTRPA